MTEREYRLLRIRERILHTLGALFVSTGFFVGFLLFT